VRKAQRKNNNFLLNLYKKQAAFNQKRRLFFLRRRLKPKTSALKLKFYKNKKEFLTLPS